MSHDTKHALLDAAERLFASQGIQETTLRAITQEADANLASVNYHFGSKDGLIRAVLDRRIQPMNDERLRLLDSYEAQAGDRPVQLESVVHAFVAPAFRLGDSDSQTFAAMLGRLHFERDDNLQALLHQSFEQVIERFFRALSRSLPELSKRQLIYRFHFAVGAMAMTVTNSHMIVRNSRGLITSIDPQNTIDRLVNFLVAAFRAPRSGSEIERD
jgi:AcrR family transcriptional regulator